jgi:hypothetical protein
MVFLLVNSGSGEQAKGLDAIGLGFGSATNGRERFDRIVDIEGRDGLDHCRSVAAGWSGGIDRLGLTRLRTNANRPERGQGGERKDKGTTHVGAPMRVSLGVG